MTTVECVQLLLRSNVTLFEYRLLQQLSSIQNMTVLGRSPIITYKLRNVNSIRCCCLHIATEEWEIDYYKSEIVVVEFYL